MVTLIGMGSGKWEALSEQAQQAVRSAGLVFGAKRLLAGLPADCTAPRGCIRAFPASSCFQRRWADRGRTGSWSRPMAVPATRWPSA